MQQNIKVLQNGTTTFNKRRRAEKSVSPSSELYLKYPSSKKIHDLNLRSELYLGRKRFRHDMQSNDCMPFWRKGQLH